MGPLAWIAALAVGVAAAVPILLLFRRRGRRVETIAWAQALLVAALIYVAFALFLGAPHRAGVELLGVLAYGACALVGLRWAPAVAIGWWLHAVWDLLHHGDASRLGGPWVPFWYPAACLGFDGLVGTYLGVRWLGRG